MFKGLSMLREDERKAASAQAGPQKSAMAEYLKRYTSEGAGADGDGGGGEKKKRKKKKAAAATVGATGGAIRIVDHDEALAAAAAAPARSRPPDAAMYGGSDGEQEDQEDEDCKFCLLTCQQQVHARWASHCITKTTFLPQFALLSSMRRRQRSS
jgi:hypothetical protein